MDEEMLDISEMSQELFEKAKKAFTQDILDSIDASLDYLEKPREGFIINSSGARAGLWKVTLTQVLIIPESKDLKELVQEVKKQGGYFHMSGFVSGENMAHTFSLVPFREMTLGHWDEVLKSNEFYIIESLP